jgi:transcriptional regulator GlxA family with amidase domain
VCPGSLLLGAAGLLDGLRATSHWLFHDRLRGLGAEPVAERVVIDGEVITAAGVSSGIDMALRLAQLEAGDAIAQAIQLAIEYNPNPRSTRGHRGPLPATWWSSSTAAPRGSRPERRDAKE